MSVRVCLALPTKCFTSEAPLCPKKDKVHITGQDCLTQKVEAIFALSWDHCVKRCVQISGQGGPRE